MLPPSSCLLHPASCPGTHLAQKFNQRSDRTSGILSAVKSLGHKFLKSALLFLLLSVLALGSLPGVFGQARTKPRRKVLAKGRVGQVGGTVETAKAHAAQNPAGDESVESADVAITATVRASSLKFDVVPNPTVEFPGKPDHYNRS